MADVDDDVRAMKVVELRAALTALGLDTKGLKAVLVERLMEARRREGAEAAADENEEEDEVDDEEEDDALDDVGKDGVASESPSSGVSESEDEDEEEEEEVNDALAARSRASASKANARSSDDDEGSGSESESDDGDDASDSDSQPQSSSEDDESDEGANSDSNAEDEDVERAPGEAVLNERMIFYVGKSIETHCHMLKLRQRCEADDYTPTKEDIELMDTIRDAILKHYDAPLPSLESEAKAQAEERRRKNPDNYGLPKPSSEREGKLSALPTDGWRLTRKKERTKLKASDPEAQGRMETRKLLEDGAGLFVAPADPTKVKREIRKNERQTAGKGWFDMKAVEYTPELRREMRMLKLRGAYDPKRFYKNADTTKLPTHFQIGTVVGGATDFYSARLAKRDQKQSLAEEILHDKDIERVRRGRFAKIQEKNAGSMGRKAKRRLGGRERGNSFHKKQKP